MHRIVISGEKAFCHSMRRALQNTCSLRDPILNKFILSKNAKDNIVCLSFEKFQTIPIEDEDPSIALIIFSLDHQFHAVKIIEKIRSGRIAENISDVPIILISAIDFKELKSNLILHHIDDYSGFIKVPFHLVQLKESLENVGPVEPDVLQRIERDLFPSVIRSIVHDISEVDYENKVNDLVRIIRKCKGKLYDNELRTFVQIVKKFKQSKICPTDLKTGINNIVERIIEHEREDTFCRQ